MLYTTTAKNDYGINGTASLSTGKLVKTSHPLIDLPGFNPEELIALAWSTCLNATIKKQLSDQGNDRLKSHVEVRVDLMTEKDCSGYFFQVSATAAIQDQTAKQSHALIESAHACCPISKLFKGAKTVTLQAVDWN